MSAASHKGIPVAVAIMAHPDDVAHSMGGTAWLLQGRCRLHVLCITKGQRGIAGKTHRQAAAIRQKEEVAACKLLGADLTFLGRIDGEVHADRALCRRAAAILRRVRPAAVFTHWPINDHADHVAAYTLAVQAVRLAGLYDEVEIYMSENAIGVQTNQFSPDLYVDISGVIEAKKALIRCHPSQRPDERAVDDAVARNVFRGMLAGCPYAEGFKTIHPRTVNSRRGRTTLLSGLGRP